MGWIWFINCLVLLIVNIFLYKSIKIQRKIIEYQRQHIDILEESKQLLMKKLGYY